VLLVLYQELFKLDWWLIRDVFEILDCSVGEAVELLMQVELVLFGELQEERVRF